MKTYKFRGIGLEVMAEHLGEFTYREAVLELVKLNDGWRLPYLREVSYLRDLALIHGKEYAKMIMDFGINTGIVSDYCWTWTFSDDSTNKVEVLRLIDGASILVPTNRTDEYLVRGVRKIPVNI